MVEVQKAATACEKWLDTPEMHEVYLCTDRARANAVGIRTPASTGIPVADQCHRDCVENPTHREKPTRVNKAFVAAFELIISRTHGTRKRMAIFKSSVEPICVFAVGMRPFLSYCRCGKRKCDDKCDGQARYTYEPSFSVSVLQCQHTTRQPPAACVDEIALSLDMLVLVCRGFGLQSHLSSL